MNISGNQLVVRIILLVGGLIVGGAIASAITGCTNGGAGDAAEATKVKEAFNECAVAARDGDLERWLSLWADDGKRMAPNAPASVGVEQIRAAIEPGFEFFTFEEFTINADEVQILGDQAYAHGTYGYSMMPKAGGDTIEDSGKFLTIFEKQADDSWKIAIDSFSSNLPAP